MSCAAEKRGSGSHTGSRAGDDERGARNVDGTMTTPQQPNATTHPQPEPEHEPYCVYSPTYRRLIVIIAAMLGFVSPLTGNIYFPAVDVLASDFNRSVTEVNLTITLYMIVQGLAPSFWSPLADHYGRRFVYIWCMLVYAGANLGLALCTNYTQLVILRILQAAGSSSTIALGAGVIGDIASAEERGTFIGFYTVGPMVGPSIGPVLGGILTDRCGWRGVFWFLFGFSIAALILVIVFLPETLRSRVGNGSIKVPIYMRSVFQILHHSNVAVKDSTSLKETRKPFSFSLFVTPLRWAFFPDIFCVLVYNSLFYAVYMTSTATLSNTLTDKYHLSIIKIGLCYLAVGIGAIIGSILNGYILDRDFARYHKKHASHLTLVELRDRKMYGFPLEHARFKNMPVYSIIFCACILGYGWTLQEHVYLAVPLIFHFGIGITSTMIMAIAQTILVDLSPRRAAGVTASNNLFRCLMGAWTIAISDYVSKGIGVGYGYMAYLGLCVIAVPFFIYEWRNGQRYREKRLLSFFPELASQPDVDKQNNPKHEIARLDLVNQDIKPSVEQEILKDSMDDVEIDGPPSPTLKLTAESVVGSTKASIT